MKHLVNVVAVFAICCLCHTNGQSDGSTSSIEEEYSVEVANTTINDTTTPPTSTQGSVTVSVVRGNVGVWRPRQRIRGHRFRPSRYQGYQRRHRGQYIRRRPNGVITTRVTHPRQRVGSNSNVRRRMHQLRRQGQDQGRRLVATGSHSVSSISNSQRQGGGVDPFEALQNGHRRTSDGRNVFQNRQTAYDFLSNGGNRPRVRNERRREQREENARMAAVMCGVFGKQFVPSAIGGRCVDP